MNLIFPIILWLWGGREEISDRQIFLITTNPGLEGDVPQIFLPNIIAIKRILPCLVIAFQGGVAKARKKQSSSHDKFFFRESDFFSPWGRGEPFLKTQLDANDQRLLSLSLWGSPKRKKKHKPSFFFSPSKVKQIPRFPAQKAPCFLSSRKTGLQKQVSTHTKHIARAPPKKKLFS